ncbi:MAG TPA: DUF1553 domain-containing protein [Bryobacteraceae bacterium]|nr:DUF1553 domain-containing protein [Bryobacteraceae bacterium]
MPLTFSLALPVLAVMTTGLAAQGAPSGAANVEFNRDIRPILSDKCYACHGPDKGNRQAGLRLDVEETAKGKLADGRIPVVPGEPEKSEVFRRISSDNKGIRMPPAYSGHDKLSAHDIGLIRQWIAEGAPWQKHWAYIPPVKPEIPASANAIDYLVRQRLEREGLKPAPRADKPTLLRRVTLDLTGLPPSLEDLNAFLKDDSPKAYERVVDRLLASPRYGERMAFRWMEAARYADTNGYQSDGNRQMWRWRDWVIEAFNKNMPFDEFTIDQIAGDLLPHPTLDQKIATAFHRNHRTNAEGGIVPEEFRVEYVADRVQTTSIVWMGMTVGCARCHDHKYDPIPQKDFYRMAAFFNNVPENGLVYNWGNDDPLIKAPTPDQQVKLAELNRKAEAAEAKYKALGRKVQAAQRKWEKKAAKGSVPDWTVTKEMVFRQKGEQQFDGKKFETEKADKLKLDYLTPISITARIKPESENGAILSKTEDYDEGAGHALYIMKGHLRLHIIYRWTDIGLRVESEETIPLHQWENVAATYDGKRYASGVRMYLDGKPLKVKILFDQLNWPMDSKEPIRVGAGGGLRFNGAIADARMYTRALTPDEVSAVGLTESLEEISKKKPEERTAAELAKLRLAFLETALPPKIRQVKDRMEAAQLERDKYDDSLPTVMVMKDEPGLRKTYVLKRGSYDAHGEEVTAGVPSVLPQLPANGPQNRLGLARWLVDRQNPLTARVVVNRYWQMLFGVGLVKTVEDFGSQGEWPLNQGLLDWLAVDFMDSGWNVKHVLKTMVMSETYQQSSKISPELLQRDPENRLLARGPRFRLPPEMIRDQALYTAGLLVEKLGGPSVKPYQPAGLWQELGGGDGYVTDKGEGLYRRSLYTFWKRTVAPPEMVNFDSPTRDTCTVMESRTNTPLQALTLMDDVTYVEAARKLAERVMLDAPATPQGRIEYAFRTALARMPRPGEEQAVLDMLKHFEARYQKDPKAASSLLSEGESVVSPRLQPTELAAYTTVASLLLNLDEMVTKE